jgi:hypothetical protein
MRHLTRVVALAVAIAALAAILGACNGNGENDDPTALPSPRTLLDDATNQISSASSFTIEISVSGMPVRIQVGDIALPEEIPLIFEYARGTFVAPDRLQAAIDIRVGDAVARTELIALGPDQYMRSDLLTQGSWVAEQVISGFSPADLMAPETGIPSALAKVQNLEIVERTDLDGVPVYHLTGTIDAADMHSLTFGLMGARVGAMQIDLYVLTEGHWLEQIVMQEPLPEESTEEGDEPTRWTISVLDYNQDVTIEAPAPTSEQAQP